MFHWGVLFVLVPIYYVILVRVVILVIMLGLALVYFLLVASMIHCVSSGVWVKGNCTSVV